MTTTIITSSNPHHYDQLLPDMIYEIVNFIDFNTKPVNNNNTSIYNNTININNNNTITNLLLVSKVWYDTITKTYKYHLHLNSEKQIDLLQYTFNTKKYNSLLYSINKITINTDLQQSTYGYNNFMNIISRVKDQLFELNIVEHVKFPIHLLNQMKVNLKHLTLKNRQLSSNDICNICTNFENLIYLDISNNNINEESVKYLNTLDKLEHLNISHNCLGTSGTKLLKLPKLTNLEIGHNTIGNDGLYSICTNFRNLKYLNCENNRITMNGSIHLKKLDQLTHLNISFNKLLNEGVKCIVQEELEHLKYVNTRFNQIDNTMKTHLKNIEYIKVEC